MTELVASTPKYIAPGEKILAHPDLIQDVRLGKPRVPRHFELDPTNRCNLACDGCHFAYIHESSGVTNKDMSLPLFEKIVTDMAKNEVKAITFTGGGEPLFHPQHLEMFKIAKAQGLELGMYTTGVLLQGKTADFVAENFLWCYVSLDAVDADEYFGYKKRGAQVFERNVKNIADFAARADRRANIGVGYLINQRNLSKVDQAVDWLLDLGTDMVQVRPTIDVGSYQQQVTDRQMSGVAFEGLNTEAWQQHYSWIKDAREVLDKYADTPRLDTSPKKFHDLFRGTRSYDVCYSTSLTGCIGAEGIAWRCVNLRGMDALGDMKTQTLSEIYGQKRVDFSDLTRCRVMCRNDQLNQALYGIIQNPDQPLTTLSPNIKHTNFI